MPNVIWVNCNHNLNKKFDYNTNHWQEHTIDKHKIYS